MSTKIFAAYKYNGTIEELIKELNVIRDEYYKEAYDYLKKIFIESYDPKKQERIRAIFDFQKLVKTEMDSMQRSPLSKEASAMVYFSEGEIYVQFFIDRYGEPKNLSENFIDYHYQNQTDRPDEISEEEWNKRNETWEKILGGSGIPSQAGLMFEIFGDAQLTQLTMDLMDDTAKKK